MIATKFYLDARRTPRGRPAPLKISIHWKGQTAYFNTGHKILPSQWDSASSQAKDRSLQRALVNLKLKVDDRLSSLQEDGRLDGLGAREIKDIIERGFIPGSQRRYTFLEVLESFAATRPQPRTREIYLTTRDRIRAFDENADSIGFSDITIGWLERFDSFLSVTSPKKNARNIHLRNIRAVFNHALKKELTSCGYPFRLYKVRPEETNEIALSPVQLRALFNADVSEWQRKYIDFFKLSFLLVGMNTEDLLHVTSRNLNGDRMEYSRAKTHKWYSIKIEPECREILGRYQGKAHLLNVLDTYSRTKYWTSKVNGELKKICRSIGLPAINMYCARHSWATIARELDIPDGTISAAMGHHTKTVTDTYIHTDLRPKIDRANRQVIDYTIYDKRQPDMYDLIRQLNDKVSKLA